MIDGAVRQRESLQETAHRPWPLPARPWLMGQTWEDLLFAHWPVPAAALRLRVPEGLTIDEHSGSAWLGATPFHLSGLRLRGTLPLPVLSSFPELNVRTYVTAGGKPGIWFFSLETPSRLAVAAARRLYRLPYRRARVVVRRDGERLRYDGETLTARVEPSGPPSPAVPGSLEWFLAERYCHYAADGGTLYRADIHHRPWPLQPATGDVHGNVRDSAGVTLPGAAPLLHFSRRQDTLIWSLEQL